MHPAPQSRAATETALELLPEIGAYYVALEAVEHSQKRRMYSSPEYFTVTDIVQGGFVRVMEIDLATQQVRVSRDSSERGILIPMVVFREKLQKVPPGPVPDIQGIYCAKREIKLYEAGADSTIPQGAKVVIIGINNHGAVQFSNQDKIGVRQVFLPEFWSLVTTEKRFGMGMTAERGLEILHPEGGAKLRATDSADAAQMKVRMYAHTAIKKALEAKDPELQ